MRQRSRYFEEDEDDDKEEEYQREHWNGGKQNGFVMKEVDISQIPAQLLRNLTQVKPHEGGILSPDDIDTDGDAWILQCPKHVELQTLLKGKKIHLNGNPTVLNTPEEEDDQIKMFESIAHSQQDSGESVSLLLPDVEGNFKMVSVPLKGYIMIKEHVEELPPPEIKIPRRKMHKLPKGIKERHPIYGVDFSHADCKTKVTCSPRKKTKYQTKNKSFSEYSKQPTFTEARLNGKHNKKHKQIVKEEFVTPTKTKKSKKRKRDQEESAEELVEEQVDVTPVKPRKSKKLKMELVDQDLDYNTPSQEFKKSKKSKSR